MIIFWILYPIYFLLALVFIILIALNTKKIRRKYNFDTLPIYLVLYLFNVFIVLGLLKAGIIGLLITTLVMLYVIVKTSNVQIIGITGIYKGNSTELNRWNWNWKVDSVQNTKSGFQAPSN